MCGLDAYKDAIVGSLGVEMKKRTTIGVELAAKVSPCLSWPGRCRHRFTAKAAFIPG